MTTDTTSNGSDISFKGIIYPVVRSQSAIGRVAGKYLKASQTHMVTAYPGELEFREIISSSQGKTRLGEPQCLPCPWGLNRMLTLPRDGRTDLILLVFAPAVTRFSSISYQVMGYESGALVGKYNYNIMSRARNVQGKNIECIVCGSKIVSIVDDHTIVAFQFKEPLGGNEVSSNLVTYTDETRVLKSITPIDADNVVVRSYGPGFRSSWRIIGFRDSRGKLEVNGNKPAPEIDAFAADKGVIDVTWTGVSGLLLCTCFDDDKNYYPMRWLEVCLSPGNVGKVEPTSHTSAPIQLPGKRNFYYENSPRMMLLQDMDLVTVWQQSGDGTSLVITHTLGVPVSIVKFRGRQLIKARPVQDISGFKKCGILEPKKAHVLGLPELDKMLFCIEEGVFECSINSQIVSLVLKPLKRVQKPKHCKRLVDENNETALYIVGDQSDEELSIHTQRIEVQKFTRGATYSSLGELPNTSSVHRIFDAKGILVLSTNLESRFLRVNTFQSSLMTIDVRGWVTGEPTLCVFQEFQVTPSGFYSESCAMKSETSISCAAARHSRCAIVYEFDGKWHVDVYERDDSKLLKKDHLCKSYSSRVVDVDVSSTGDIAVLFPVELLTPKGDSMKLSHAANCVVSLDKVTFVGTLDGQILTFEGTRQRTLRLGATPVNVVNCGQLVIASCSTKTVVFTAPDWNLMNLDPTLDIEAVACLSEQPDVVCFSFADRSKNLEIGRVVANGERNMRSEYYSCDLAIDFIDPSKVLIDPDTDETYVKTTAGLVSFGPRIGKTRRFLQELEGENFLFTGASSDPSHPHSLDVIVAFKPEEYSWKIELKFIFPKLGFYEKTVPTKAFFSSPECLWALPPRSDGTARVRFRSREAFMLDVSIKGTEITIGEMGRWDLSGLQDCSSADTYLVPELALRPTDDLAVYHIPSTTLYTEPFGGAHESSSFLSNNLIGARPLVLSARDGSVDVMRIVDSDGYGDGALDDIAAVHMPDLRYITQSIEPWEVPLSSFANDHGADKGIQQLRPSAMLVGLMNGDVSMLISSTGDCGYIDELFRIDSELRKDVQTFAQWSDNDQETHKLPGRLIDGSLLRRFFTSCDLDVRLKVYERAHVDVGRGEAICKALSALYG